MQLTKIRNCFSLLLSVSVSLCAISGYNNSVYAATLGSASSNNFSIGANVGGINGELPFVDVMKYATDWRYVPSADGIPFGFNSPSGANCDKKNPANNFMYKDEKGNALIPYDANKCPIIALNAKGYPTDNLPVNINSSAVKKVMIAGGDNVSAKVMQYLDQNTTTKFVLRTTILTHNGANFPAGNYSLSFKGKGIIRIGGTVKQSDYNQENGVSKNFVVNVTNPNSTGFVLDILKNDPLDPINDIKLIMPRQSITLNDVVPDCMKKIDCAQQAEYFNPVFLKTLKPFKTLRFMDWLQTNDNDVVKFWADATPPDYYSQASKDKGVSLAYIVALGNVLGKDIWINIPPQANYDYIQKSADYVRDHFDKNLKVYLEYANETWNSAAGFHKTWKFVQDYGVAHGIKAAEASFDLSKNAWDVWAQEFGVEKGRFYRVLAGQFANPWTISVQIKRAIGTASPDDPHKGFDVISGAPYLGKRAAKVDTYNATTTSHQIAQDMLDYLNSGEFGKRLDTFMLAINKLQPQIGYKHPVIMYEGGYGLDTDSPDVSWYNAFLGSVNDPTMYDVYIKYFNELKLHGVSGLNQYTSVGRHSTYGLWGLLEYQGQAPTQRYKAILDLTNNPQF